MNNIERRTLQVEFRADNKAGKLRGVAAVFNSLSEDLGGFREQIAPGAFSSAISTSDVRALVNHDPNLVLGRTAAGTLRLQETDAGLEFELDLPDTTYARDLVACMQRGDINQCSFGFSIGTDGDSWTRDKVTESWTRTINNVARLYDVSPVTYPAYADTACALRSLEQVQQTTPPAYDEYALEQMKLSIEIAEAE